MNNLTLRIAPTLARHVARLSHKLDIPSNDGEGEDMALDVRVKRIYDPFDPEDGYRVLIDHAWPRGVSHERARLDEWARGLAPTNELRRRAANGRVTVLYAARDREHNNAVVLAELLRDA
jgi:uncharacterized protein YeaO (DUF488 family)